MKNRKKTIYQAFPRLFGNTNSELTNNGNIHMNGCGKFADFSDKALAELVELGITDIWYTGIIEHATKTDYTAFGIPKVHDAIVKGNAGSPYAIKDYYSVCPDLAKDVNKRMDEFRALVKRTHDAGLKVIIDFVPNHVSRQYCSNNIPAYIKNLGEEDNRNQSFCPTNNFYYLPGSVLTLHFGAKQEDFEYSEFPAKVTGNDLFSPTPSKNDWYETIKLNYGVDYMNGRKTHFSPIPNTWEKMLDILLFWADQGVDGFRCDMAEMVPVEFWNWVIPQVKRKKDIFFIAEIYNPNAYRSYLDYGQFDYLYDKVGLYEVLRNVITGNESASKITRTWQAIEGIQSRMLNFLENHDEQRIASDFFAGSPWPGIPGFIVAALMNTNPVMLYNGQELGERGMDCEGYSGKDGRTSIFDYWSMSTVRAWYNKGKFDNQYLTEEQQKLRETYANILKIARDEPAITQGVFFDLMYVNLNNPHFNPDKQYAFVRNYKNDVILVVANFENEAKEVQVNLPLDFFHYAHLPENKAAQVTNLLTGKTSIGTLTAEWPYQVSIEPYSAAIIKFDFKNV